MSSVRRTISISEGQAKWADENSISLSSIVQKELKKRMVEPQQTQNPNVPLIATVYTLVLVLGMAAVLFGLLAPSMAGAHLATSFLVVVIGAAVTAYGLIQLRTWQAHRAGV